eukprot:15463932-Alexandrium_andersonii.AAC.1
MPGHPEGRASVGVGATRGADGLHRGHRDEVLLARAWVDAPRPTPAESVERRRSPRRARRQKVEFARSQLRSSASRG